MRRSLPDRRPTRDARDAFPAAPDIDIPLHETIAVHGPPNRLLLLYVDRSDPVTRILLERAERFAGRLVAIPLARFLDEVTVGPTWQWHGTTIDPARTAVVNRLTVSRSDDPASPLSSYSGERQLWRWLHRALQRFAYASSLPTATSLIGDHGSLLDQWQDLPALVDGLRVPVHRSPWTAAVLHGDVHRVDPWQLYSLGARAADPGTSGDPLLSFQRPGGSLVHVAQVGGLLLVANAPPGMTSQQQSYIVSFVRSMASRSDLRILEHAFFVGDDLPVFYSTCPSPVITGSLSDYPDLLIHGLLDDIQRRSAASPA